MGGLFKGVVIAAGAGIVALTVLKRPAAPVAAKPKSSGWQPETEGLLNRLKSLEASMEAIQNPAAQSLDDWSGALAELGRRVQLQEAELRAVRASAADSERRRGTIDERISERISSIERTLLDQSVSIGVLRQKAEASDSNLDRLVVALDKLCERAQIKPPDQAMPDPFQAQLQDAMQRPNPEPTVSRELRPRLPEPPPEERKPRIPMARIF